MKNNKLLNSKEPYNSKDTEKETYGCRHTNPNICSNNSIPGVCAFASEDCICKRPPRSWKKIFEKLKLEVENND